LKTATARLEADPDADLSEREREFIDQSLATAWRSCEEKYGADPSAWQEAARAAVADQRLGYYETLDGFPALDASKAIGLFRLNAADRAVGAAGAFIEDKHARTLGGGAAARGTAVAD
jgi:hypothetical protein